MNFFEKKQMIEVVRTVIRGRWFYVLAFIGQGLIIKTFFKSVPLAATPIISAIAFGCLLVNFAFWLYLRRPIEKINEKILIILKPFQVFCDIIALWFVFFFSGTANKMLFVAFFIVAVNSVILYRKKGIILSTFFIMVSYSGLIILELYKFLPDNPQAFSPYLSLRSQPELAISHLIGFNSYLVALAFVVWFLASLFRKREKILQERTDEAVYKTETLTKQTKELTETKDWLHNALMKSDRARCDLAKTKEDLEKTNLDLQIKINELERFNKVTLGREIKMSDLKNEIKKLNEKIIQLELEKK